MLERIRRQPLIVIAIAAAVIVFGVDLTALSDTVQQLLQLLTTIGALAGAHRTVTPVADPRDNDGRPLTPADQDPQ